MKKEVAKKRMVIKAFDSSCFIESIALRDHVVAGIKGKDSLRRITSLSYSTTGYIDPTWQEYLTLDLLNSANLPTMLYYNIVTGRSTFLCLTSSTGRLRFSSCFGSNYQWQKEHTSKKYYEEFTNWSR